MISCEPFGFKISGYFLVFLRYKEKKQLNFLALSH